MQAIDKPTLDTLRELARAQQAANPHHGPHLRVECLHGAAEVQESVFDGGLLLSVEHYDGEPYAEGRAVLTPAQARELAAALVVMADFVEGT